MSPLSLTLSSARHPRIVIAAWALVFVISLGIAGALWGQGLTAERNLLVDSESGTADSLLEERVRGPRRFTEIVVVHSDTYTIADPQFEATVQNLFFDMAALGPDVVAGISQYYHSGSDYRVSDSGHSTIMTVTMAGTLDEARANAPSVLGVVRRHGGQDDFTVRIVGESTIADRVADLVYSFSLIPLFLPFIPAIMASRPALRLPILVGLVSVIIPVGLSVSVEQVQPMSLFNYIIILVTGLAVGMSSTHLIAVRYREERGRGLDNLDAIARTGATTTKAVLLGGSVAAIAVASMAIVPVNTFTSIAIGAFLATLVPLLASVTLSPALLALPNDRFSGFRLPSTDEAETPPRRRIDLQGLVKMVAEKALARPVLSVAIAAVVLLALAAVAPCLDFGLTGVESLPERLDGGAYSPQVKRAYNLLTENFPAGVISPVEIVIDAPFKDPNVEPRVAQLQAALSTDPGFAGESRIQNNQDHDMVLFTVPTSHLPESESAHDAVRRLRDVYIPELFADTGVNVVVTGGPALAADYVEVVEDYAPYVAAVVLASSVLGVLIATRSVVFPFLATIAHLLSLAAAYGIVVIAIQKGIGAGLGLLRYHHTPTIESWGVVFTFALMFGVYVILDLYLAARIREKYLQTDDSIEAVTYGLRSTAWVSTVASLIMVGVFLC